MKQDHALLAVRTSLLLAPGASACNMCSMLLAVIFHGSGSKSHNSAKENQKGLVLLLLYLQ